MALVVVLVLVMATVAAVVVVALVVVVGFLPNIFSLCTLRSRVENEICLHCHQLMIEEHSIEINMLDCWYN